MANPNIAQGNLNRLLASVSFPNIPTLNITPSYLAPEAIDMAFEGQSTAPLSTLTGLANSPEPYVVTRVTIHMNRAQAFANAWKLQWEGNTLLGPAIVRPDSPTLSPYNLSNCSISNFDRLGLAGRDIGFVITITGAYSINATMWN